MTLEQPPLDDIRDAIRKLEEAKEKLNDMKYTLGNKQEFLQEHADVLTKVDAAKEIINHLAGTFNKPR